MKRSRKRKRVRRKDDEFDFKYVTFLLPKGHHVVKVLWDNGCIPQRKCGVRMVSLNERSFLFLITP